MFSRISAGIKKITLNNIYKSIESEILQLNFPNLMIEDKLIVNGSAIRENNKLLPNKLSYPLNEISDSEIKAFINLNNKNARYYQLIQVKDWEGELILSIFLRFSKNDKNLFVESTYYILPPLKEEYKALKNISPFLSFRDYIGSFVSSLFLTIFEMLGSLIFVFGKINEGIYKLIYGRNSQEREEYLKAKNSPTFNYGAKYSIRELVSSNSYQQYFQVLDKDKYLKIIEKRVLNTITDFLDKHNIDVSEFKERGNQILNNGIVITGGSLKADNIAVGKKSKLNQTINNAIKATGISPND